MSNSVFFVNSYLELIELANRLHADVQHTLYYEDIDVYTHDKDGSYIKFAEIFIEYEGYNIEILNKEVIK